MLIAVWFCAEDGEPGSSTAGHLELVGPVAAMEGLMSEVGILLDDHSEMWRQYQGLPMNRRHSHQE